MQNIENQNNYTLHYKTWHSNTDEHKQDMSAFYEKIFGKDLLKISKSLKKKPQELRILDFGCGMGFFLNSLRDKGYESLKGYELDKAQAQTAREMGFDVEQSDDPLEWLKNCNSNYDVIFSIDVLEHIQVEYLQQTLEGMKNIISKNGALVATVPNANATMSARWRYIDWTHKVSFTEHSLSHIVRSSGFNVESIVPSEIIRFYKKPRRNIHRLTELLMLKFARGLRRIEVIGEFGWDEGIEIPLTTNIKIIAIKE